MPFFIPLGIPDFNGKKERDFFQFTYHIEDNDACELIVQIRNGNIVWYEETITDASKLTQGEHIWQWNGFDNDGILDTAKFTQAKRLNFYATGKDNDGNIGRSSTDFEVNYDKVNWVDIKIDKNTKRIDVTLRVNLTDGGEIGTEKDCKEEVKIDYLNPGLKSSKAVCPWEKIPEKDLKKHGQNPITTRTKSFEELKELVLEGINIYWSRRYTNTQGTIINDENWEIIVTAVNTNDSSISLDDIPLIYNTNNTWSRSGNPGSSKFGDGNVMDELAKILPDGVVQRISYNVGYIKYSNGWFYQYSSDEDSEFKFTSAHEIGHEILQAYAGNVYSWQHKGSSYYLPQDKKPIGKESFKEEYINRDFMEETKGENYPPLGKEVDLMKYYHNDLDIKNRIVAAEKDALGLLWLTKLNLK